VINNQINYNQHKELGFDRENVVVMDQHDGARRILYL